MKKLLAKPVVEALGKETAKRVEAFEKREGRKPKLAVVLVGEDPASVIYTTKKGERAVALGMEHQTLKFPKETPFDEFEHEIEKLNKDESVHGILLQRPLPYPEEDVVYLVDRHKDVDAFHPENTGRLNIGLPCLKPCTPSGVMEMLKHYQIDLSGKLACVIGRSTIVGKPMAAMLTAANATVIQCHSRTRELAALTKQAKILVVAAGKPKLIGKDHIRAGTVVVDVGIHRQDNGKLCGDVDFDSVADIAEAITPVPGGVGPMTIAMLMRNTVKAAENHFTN